MSVPMTRIGNLAVSRLVMGGNVGMFPPDAKDDDIVAENCTYVNEFAGK